MRVKLKETPDAKGSSICCPNCGSTGMLLSPYISAAPYTLSAMMQCSDCDVEATLTISSAGGADMFWEIKR